MNVDSFIKGGVETTIANHPHQLVMLKGGSFTCGGSIISTQWALTAVRFIYFFKLSSLLKDLFRMIIGSLR